MKKYFVGIIMVIIIIAVIIALVFFGKKDNNVDELKLQTASQMKSEMESIYKKLGSKLPDIGTREIDINDENSFSLYTGLTSNENVETVVVSEPYISSQAYSAVLVKVKDTSSIEEMKEEMLNNIDTAKWICVVADKVYVTNYENIIFLIMSDDEWAKPVYDEFKISVDGKIGKELQRVEIVNY